MSLQRLTNSLLFRLTALGVLLMVGGSIVRYIILSDFLRQDLIQVVSAQQESLAGYVARDIEEKVISRRRLLEQLAATIPHRLLGQPTELRGWLAERHRAQPLFALGLTVLDVGGRAIADFPAVPGRVGASFADHPDFRTAVDGDEFVVLAADLDTQASGRMESLARKCLEVMAVPLMVKGTECRVGVSIGIAIGDGTLTPDQLLIAADDAMCSAKEAGRGCFVTAPGG